MTVGEAQKLLTKNGFNRRNQVGSHITYVKNDKRITLVLHCSPKEIVHKKTEKALKELIK